MWGYEVYGMLLLYMVMEIQIQPHYIRNAVIALILVILATISFFGFRAGRDLARADLAVKQTAATMKALDYFFSDQDRYPTATEFGDPQTFGIYLSQVPIPLVASKQCPRPLAYSTFNQRTFVMRYCLPREFQGQLPGAYDVSERDISSWLE